MPQSSSSSIPPNYSPVTIYSQSSLEAPVPTTAQSETALVTPSPTTKHSQTGLNTPIPSDTYIATISRQPDGKPTQSPDQGPSATGGDGPISTAGSQPNPSQNLGGIIASIAHQYATSTQSAGVSTATTPSAGPSLATTPSARVSVATSNPTAASVYLVDGTTLTPGASAATIHGTTYSVAPSGGVIYVNGQTSSISAASSRGSGIAPAIMSGLHHAASPTGESTKTSLTLVTASQKPSASSSGSPSSVPSPALQSSSGAARSVSSGLSLAFLCALVSFL